MSKTMLISVDWEIRVAFLNDNILEEIHIEHRGFKEEHKSNVYKGIVEQVQPSINAAFVNIGLEKNAFLALDSVDYSVYKPKKSIKKDISIQSVLEENQEVIVQVTKDATPSKGACLTTFISIPGRYLVLYSSPNMSGISKRIIQQREKVRLSNFIDSMTKDQPKSDHSIIIRTAAMEIPSNELEKEYLQLKDQWTKIIESNKTHSKPALLLKEKPFISKIIRDHYTNNVDEIYVDDANAFQLVQEDLSQHHTVDTSKLQFYSEITPLFSHFNIEQAIRQLSDRKVVLPSGAYLVIDQTEALVAIDVNSGSAKSSGSVEDLIFQINDEAAQESARQVRLRNLSGLIVIDFIDMQSKEQKRQIEETLKFHFKQDKAQYTIHPISHLGLMELSRQKLGKNLPGSALTNCPSCKGLGKIISAGTQVNRILRQIKMKAQRGNFLEFTIYISSYLNKVIQENHLSFFENLETDYNIKITIEEEANFELSDEAEIVAIRDETKPTIEPDKMIEQPQTQKLEKISQNFLFNELEVSKTEKAQVLNDFKSHTHQENKESNDTSIAKKYLWEKLKPAAQKKTIVPVLQNKTLQKDEKHSRPPRSYQKFEKQTVRNHFKKTTLQKKNVLEKVADGIKNFLGIKPEEKVQQPTRSTQHYSIRKNSSSYGATSFNRSSRPSFQRKEYSATERTGQRKEYSATERTGQRKEYSATERTRNYPYKKGASYTPHNKTSAPYNRAEGASYTPHNKTSAPYNRAERAEGANTSYRGSRFSNRNNNYSTNNPNSSYRENNRINKVKDRKL